MALFHFHVKMISRSNGNCVRSLAYRAGCKLTDPNTLESFDYRHKGVQKVELILPENAPLWAKEIQKLISENREKGVQAFSDIAEKHEKRIDAQIYREFEFALPRELTDEQNMALAHEFLQDQVAGREIGVLANFHMDIDPETGERKPHCHAALLTRKMEEDGLSVKKDRIWEKKALIKELREQLAEYTNFHLKLHGHDVRIDHRSYKEQGIDIEPQPKHGKRVEGLEKKLGGENKTESELKPENKHEDKIETKKEGKSFVEQQFSTAKGQAFREVQLRNLYRILRKPEIIFEMVTRNNVTFMWADVQKKLHQYVDSPELFQRLENRLMNSKELLLLRPEGERDEQGRIIDRAIYTTHSKFQSEKALIKLADKLSLNKSHKIFEDSLEQGLKNTNAKMEAKGHRLSPDQEKAIRHLIGEGQIKCIVGYAGAGKTTALETCREVWEKAGYRVYGLAPTGRAAKNLEDSGIQSTTLHKFLLSYENGRCRYSAKSILVLDEGGMVDLERFQKLLSAVDTLGVKVVVIGDGAQLQPVEAGPAFRLVTTRVGVSRLEEIVRQKVQWQREATVLFGKQETEKAIQAYQDHGHIHIVEEKLPQGNSPEEVVKRYEMTARTTGLIFREILRDIKEKYPNAKNPLAYANNHEDYLKFKTFREIQKDEGWEILSHPETYRPYLEARWLDPIEMARLFVKKKQDKTVQYKEAAQLLKEKKLDHLIRIEKPQGQGVDVRHATKAALIKHWKQVHKENPEKTIAIMANSNQNVRDLNNEIRDYLKAEGRINQKEFTYAITREIEDDFGRKTNVKEERFFSKGDRLIFTRNKSDLSITNGSMGTILSLDKNTIKVELDGGETLTFAPKMFSYFDQGWAITIYKSQGTTVDKSFVLASHEMNQNLTYVGMTRHREDVHVYGSSLDFWREEKIVDVLSKSGDKLGAADYLDAQSLTSLMKEEDKFLERLFTRIGDELHAMGAVSRQAFTRVSDTFFGRNREREISLLILPETIREEQRAQELKQVLKYRDIHIPQKGLETITPESLTTQTHQESQASFAGKHSTYRQNRETRPLIESNTYSRIIDAEIVEDALKLNLSSFADHVFESMGESNHRASSSATERRYGKKGHISVNLKTGFWIDHKNIAMSGAPLQMLTKLKGLSFKEAIEYGASWAGLSPEQLNVQKQLSYVSHTQKSEEEHAENRQKIKRAQAIWAKGQPLKGTLAERYLKEHRKIGESQEWPQDFRYLPNVKVSCDQNAGKSYPCLMVAARSTEGEVTAVQLTFLDPVIANKANVPVQKRSYGLLKGSAVTVQSDKQSNIIFIAEGVETALSLREAGLQGTIKASLGLANIGRLVLEDKSTHIVICGDHDAPDSPATKSLEKSAIALREHGFKVTIIKPDHLGEDFNDVLKKHGPEGVREILKQAVPQVRRLPNVIRDSNPSSVKVEAEKILNEITRTCEKHLYAYMAENNISLTTALHERIPLQAERATQFIFHANTIRGTELSEQETHPYLLRAKYELDRLSQIKEKLTDKWHKRINFDAQKDPLIIHMIAERQASIEGRLFFEAKQAGLKPSVNIPQQAETELSIHRAEAKALAQKLGDQYSLSTNAATECARNMLRYQEIHGTKPTNTQMTAMAQISRELEKRFDTPLSKEIGSHTIEYMRRMEGDSMFRQLCSQGKVSISLEYKVIQAQAKAALERQIAQDLLKINQKEISF